MRVFVSSDFNTSTSPADPQSEIREAVKIEELEIPVPHQFFGCWIDYRERGTWMGAAMADGKLGWMWACTDHATPLAQDLAAKATGTCIFKGYKEYAPGLVVPSFDFGPEFIIE